MTTTEAVGGRNVNMSQLCRLTGRSRQQLEAMVIAGMPFVTQPKGRGGQWIFDTAVVFDWLETRAAPPEEAPDLNRERARLAKLQADAQELRNARERGELLPAEEVVAGCS